MWLSHRRLGLFQSGPGALPQRYISPPLASRIRFLVLNESGIRSPVVLPPLLSLRTAGGFLLKTSTGCVYPVGSDVIYGQFLASITVMLACSGPALKGRT